MHTCAPAEHIWLRHCSSDPSHADAPGLREQHETEHTIVDGPRNLSVAFANVPAARCSTGPGQSRMVGICHKKASTLCAVCEHTGSEQVLTACVAGRTQGMGPSPPIQCCRGRCSFTTQQVSALPQLTPRASPCQSYSPWLPPLPTLLHHCLLAACAPIAVRRRHKPSSPCMPCAALTCLAADRTGTSKTSSMLRPPTTASSIGPSREVIFAAGRHIQLRSALGHGG